MGKDHALGRSTKAGASAPATHGGAMPRGLPISTAQRRPGHQPRRHSSTTSTSVTASDCAQRRPGHQPRRHTLADRPVPSTIMTAQRRPGHQPRRHPAGMIQWWCIEPLNEGRGISPGDTRGWVPKSPISRVRSTKAGASAPATRGWVPAQRTSLSDPKRVWRRSTKAGASAPATLLKSAKGRYRDGTAVFHGCGSLAGDEFAVISRNCEQYSVRMISAKQSKLPWRRRTTRGSQNH